MAINLKFDLAGNPEPPTIILANRSGKKLGQLDANTESIDLNDKFNDASEFSFTLNKYVDGEITNLWDKVVDFKLVYCKEWDKWFEISVELDEEIEIVKTVFCTQLGQAELSQINLYNIEINTEDDITRDDYKRTILYDEDNPEASILNRILEKAPHYHIAHVDPTIAKIQRSFSFDSSSIYDAHQEIAEEIGCLFDYPSNSADGGKINRAIYVYDLWQNCVECGHRGEFTDKCPKCGSTNINYGYGNDTKIFVTADMLAASGIELTTDVNSVKNCFKLEAGDDLMTATIRNCNPNGSDYIWYFPSLIKEDMSDKLVDRIDSYNVSYNDYYKNYISNIDTTLLNKYNALINKYSSYNEDLQTITKPVKGYSSLMNSYYNVIDLSLYLESGLMPSVKMEETDAAKQAALLTTTSLSSVAVTNTEIVSEATANSAVLAMAKIVVKSTYKVQVNTSSLSELNTTNYTRVWTGNFIVTNYSDEEDTAVSNTISITINDKMESFIKQKLEKALSKEDTEDLSISGLFDLDKTDNEFKAELKKYALNPLVSFQDACQACIDILIDQGIANKETWGSMADGADSNLYEKLYQPYYKKLEFIQAEIKVREDEIKIVDNLQLAIEKSKNFIQDTLNLENHLSTNENGEYDPSLWFEFSAYRREDKYSNDNYISDGLNNAELFEKALEFIEVAENEIYKSAELQHSISTTLKNLLAIEKFKDFVEYFEVGNWIRVQVDGRIYKLRLLECNIDFGSFDNISVTFSDVIKIKNGITDVQSTLSQAKSMATSYSSVQRQASQGEKSNTVIDNWITNGLDASNTKIIGDADDQNQVWDRHGILCREYDPITETYSPEQLKIINSTLAITDDNWETTKTAIGKIYHIDSITGEAKITYGVNAETIIGKLLLGETIALRNDDGTLSFDENGLVVKNGDKIVTISPQNEEVINITNGDESVFVVDENGELTINGNIMARSLKLETGVEIDSGVITNLADVAVSGNYNDLANRPKLVTVATTGNYNDLNGKPTLSTVATTGNYSDLLNKPNLATVAKSGEYSDLSGTPTVTDIISNGSSSIATSNAVFDYALKKNQGTSNTGKFLYIDNNGDIVPIGISEMKSLLGIDNIV